MKMWGWWRHILAVFYFFSRRLGLWFAVFGYAVMGDERLGVRVLGRGARLLIWECKMRNDSFQPCPALIHNDFVHSSIAYYFP